MWTWIPLFLADSFSATKLNDASRLAALVAFVVIGVGGVGSLLAGIWADRWGRSRVTIVSLIVSGVCSFLVGLLFDASPLMISILTLIWGFAVVADSAQYSASVSELAPREYIGTALTLQTSLGFLLTLVSIRLIPALETLIGWRWAFAVLAIGPALGAWAMFALKQSPDAARLANGRGVILSGSIFAAKTPRTRGKTIQKLGVLCIFAVRDCVFDLAPLRAYNFVNDAGVVQRQNATFPRWMSRVQIPSPAQTKTSRLGWFFLLFFIRVNSRNSRITSFYLSVIKYSCIFSAARNPAATAVLTRSGPVTPSPPAKTPGRLVCPSPSALIKP